MGKEGNAPGLQLQWDTLREQNTYYHLRSPPHTNRSREGTMRGFDKKRNKVLILDKCDIIQERALKNLRMETESKQTK